MGDGPKGIEVFPDHFQASTSGVDSLQRRTSSTSHSSSDLQHRSLSHLWTRRKLREAASMLNLFSLRSLTWGSGTNGPEKVVLTAAEVEALRSEIADLEEREALLKAQFEHIDEILRSARLSGYLYMRTRWAALPGEPLPIDDTEVDDWLPRFVVLHDLSPQDSTLLSDVVEVGRLPSFTPENEETRHCFFILTRHGLRYECSSASNIQVDAWLTALQVDCKLSLSSEAVARSLPQSGET